MPLLSSSPALPLSLIDELHLLLNLQHIDKQIYQAEHTLAHLNTGAALAAAYKVQQAVVEPVQSRLTAAQTQQTDLELQVGSVTEKIDVESKKLYGGTITASRELANLQTEVDALTRQKSDLERRLLGVMDEREMAKQAFDVVNGKLQGIAEEYRGIRAAYKVRAAELQKEINSCQPKRKKAMVQIKNPTLIAQYDRLRARKLGVGVAIIETGNTCSGCHTKLSTGVTQDVQGGLRVVTCETCARILATAPPA
jgi:uncharacterized protein